MAGPEAMISMLGHGGSEGRLVGQRYPPEGASSFLLPLLFLTAMSVASVLSNSTLAHVSPLQFWGPVTATLDWCEVCGFVVVPSRSLVRAHNR